MDVYIHTTLAMGVIAIAYYAGQYFSRTKDIEVVVDSLVPISELIAKALKEAKKTT